MDNKNFITKIAFLAKYLGKDLLPDRQKIYFEALKFLTDSQFNNAVQKIVESFIPTTQAPFPLIAHFLQYSGIAGTNRAQMVVLAVKKAAETVGAYNTVDFGDGALHAVINRFGGWPIVARWFDEWKFNEKNFILAYEAAYAACENDPPCKGIYEINNDNVSTAGWTDGQKRLFDRQKEPKKITWIGYKENSTPRVENKNNDVLLLSELSKNIGNIPK